jgi:hypothetical protein
MPEQPHFSSGFGVGELDAVVRALSDTAIGLTDQAGGVPQVPDAGESSADIAGALSAIYAVASTITRSIAAAGDRVIATGASYQTNDLNNADLLGGMPR